jgi:hypothetical protein
MGTLILGAILGTIGSLVVSHFYYKRSSKDFEKELDRLRNQLDTLKNLLGDLESNTEYLISGVDTVKKITVRGTTDDPEYPYK